MSDKPDLKKTGFIDSVPTPQRRFTAGILIIVPLIIIAYIFNWIIDKIPLLPSKYFNLTSYSILNEFIQISVTIILISIIIEIVGTIVKTDIGKKIEVIFDSYLNKIPIIGSLYRIAKVTVTVILSGGGEFKKPVKIKMGEIRITGFKTGRKTEDGKEIIFIPTSPNITTGLVAEIDPKYFEPTDETLSSAMTKILSAGFAQEENEKD